MKRYEYLIIAALVLLFFLMCLPVPGFAVPHLRRAGRRHRAPPQCKQQPNSFWIRNTCMDGFLTVVKNRPLVQVTGLSQDHPSAEILKESCFMPGASWDDRLQGPSSVGPYVRYQHKKSKKYICFNKQGKLRTMNLPKAQRKGRLCMFLEEAEEGQGQVYHRLRSAYNSKWYLGFNPKRTTHVQGGEERASLPRLGGKGFGPRRCDFKFFSGLHNHTDIKNDWKGIFDLLGDMDTKDSSKNTVNTKAALEDTQILDNSLNLKKEASRSQNNDLNTIETDSVIVIGKKSDKSVASAGTKKISSLYHEKLQMQQFLLRAKQHKKIRHFKHKRPRLQKQRPRRPRLQVKNQRLRNKSSPIGQKMMKKRGQAVTKKVSRPSRRRPRV